MKPLPVSNDGPPRQLGRFELVAELASGGMATVYLGRLGGAGGFQRFVAIKRLHSHLANDAEFVDMFLDEARLAARLHHQNVVPILEIGTSDVGYYLVMEYVEGETLARLLNVSHQAGAPVPINVTVRIFLDVLAGLHSAHELTGDDGRALEIVHRDVSPQNVLVGVEGSAKITDFGVAHAADRLAHTRTGQLKGKFSYMAPEQALGYSVDRRADVFAVGTCLWEALACKRLFKGDSEADTLEKVLRGTIPRLRSLVPSIPPQIEEVVARALDRDRDRRYRSAAHFAEMLEAAALHAGVLGTQRDVAAHVQRVLGPLLTQQREAVRQWIAGMEQLRPSMVDMAETRGPATRVDVPNRGSRASAASAPPPSIPISVGAPMTARPQGQMRASAAQQQQSLLAMVDERPTAAVPAAVAAAAVAAADDEMSVSSVAIGAVERSTVSQVTRPRSSTLPTLAIAAVLVAAGVAVGVFNSQASSAEETAKTETAKPQSSSTTATANRNAPPPVPTTPIGTPLAAPTTTGPSPINQLLAQATAGSAPTQGVVSPPPPLGVPGAPPPPPVPTTPLGQLMRDPVQPVTATTPTVAVNELPAAPHVSRPAYRPAPRPAPRAESRDRDRDRDRDEEPRPRRAERPSREDRGGGDDDLGRNPYK